MANVKLAEDFVLRQEDSTLSGKVTTLRGDSGGATRYGIASHYHPELVASGFFDETKVGAALALATAEQVYNQSYSAPLGIAHIADQAVAVALLSFGINAGDGQAAKIFQATCGSFGKGVVVDGHIGPATLAAGNSVNPDQFLSAFASRVKTFYTDLALSHPNDAADLRGWLNRAQAWITGAATVREQAAAA